MCLTLIYIRSYEIIGSCIFLPFVAVILKCVTKMWYKPNILSLNPRTQSICKKKIIFITYITNFDLKFKKGIVKIYFLFRLKLWQFLILNNDLI